MALDSDEKLYTRSEVLQILKGLCNVYWSKPWYARIFNKPWVDALYTAILIIGGDKAVTEILEEDFFTDLSNQLDN